MAKKNIFAPGILFTMPTPEPTTVTGGETGQSGYKPFACDFSDWLNLFAVDKDGDGDMDRDDYKLWFQALFADDPEEGQEAWALYNEGNLFP